MNGNDKDDRLYDAGKSGGDLSPEMTPEEIEQRRQFLGLRPFKPITLPQPRPRRKRRTSGN